MRGETSQRDIEGVRMLALCLPDIARCMGDAVSKQIDVRTMVFIAGTPTAVARIVPGFEPCKCRAFAVGLERAKFCVALRGVGRGAVAHDVEAPLEQGDIRVLLLIPSSTAVITMKAPAPDFSTVHDCDGRPS